MNPELKYFIEDVQSEDVEALFAVRVSSNDKECLNGETPPYITTVTCTPPDGFSREASDQLSKYLWMIGNVLRRHLEDSKAADEDGGESE